MVVPIGPWKPDTQYGPGSKVVYDNVCYEVIQPHTSLADWTPPATPALWRRLESTADPTSEQGYQPIYTTPVPPTDHTRVDSPHESQRETHSVGWAVNQAQAPFPVPRFGHGVPARNTSDSHDDSKDNHPSGNAIPDLIAKYAQAPFPLHRSGPGDGFPRDQSQSHSSGQGHGYDAWLSSARARTQAFNAEGPKAPTTWLLVEGDHAPANALPVPGAHGRDDFQICRRYHEGKMWIAARFRDRVHEVLVGDTRAVRWCRVEGGLERDFVQKEKAIEAGVDDDGKQVYAGVGEHHGEVVVGRCALGEELLVRRGDEIHNVREYSVLCYH